MSTPPVASARSTVPVVGANPDEQSMSHIANPAPARNVYWEGYGHEAHAEVGYAHEDLMNILDLVSIPSDLRRCANEPSSYHTATAPLTDLCLLQHDPFSTTSGGEHRGSMIKTGSARHLSGTIVPANFRYSPPRSTPESISQPHGVRFTSPQLYENPDALDHWCASQAPMHVWRPSCDPIQSEHPAPSAQPHVPQDPYSALCHDVAYTPQVFESLSFSMASSNGANQVSDASSLGTKPAYRPPEDAPIIRLPEGLFARPGEIPMTQSHLAPRPLLGTVHVSYPEEPCSILLPQQLCKGETPKRIKFGPHGKRLDRIISIQLNELNVPQARPAFEATFGEKPSFRFQFCGPAELNLHPYSRQVNVLRRHRGRTYQPSKARLANLCAKEMAIYIAKCEQRGNPFPYRLDQLVLLGIDRPTHGTLRPQIGVLRAEVVEGRWPMLPLSR